MANDDDWPFCARPYFPALHTHEESHTILEDDKVFDETRCSIFEATESSCRWYDDLNDQGLNDYLSGGNGTVRHFNIV